MTGDPPSSSSSSQGAGFDLQPDTSPEKKEDENCNTIETITTPPPHHHNPPSLSLSLNLSQKQHIRSQNQQPNHNPLTAPGTGAFPVRIQSTPPDSEPAESTRFPSSPPRRDSDHDSEEEIEMVTFEEGRRSRSSIRSLGDRMVMDDAHSTGDTAKEEKKRADMKVLRHLAVNGIFIGLWYTFSLLISLYNKWMFAPEHLDFKFPLFITSGHMLVQFSLASLVLFAFPHLRPGAGLKKHHHQHSIVRADPDDDDSDEGAGFFTRNNEQERKKQKSGVMTRWFYLTRLVPCGAATGLDIGLGNMSLKLISLAFYTMCKSSSLAFVLIFAFIFRLEKPTFRLITIISIMTAGVVMMVAGEARFNILGFILVMTASALSGLRWSLTQVLLLRNPATSNPFSSIFFLAPVMFVSIFVIAVPVEGFGPLFSRFGVLVGEYGVLVAIAIVLFPGVIAFLMVSSEFALLQRTSVVTLSICGIFKEVLTISVATIVFGDPLTAVNVSGLIVTIVSIAGYNYIKIKNLRQETREGLKEREQQRYEVVGGGESDLEMSDSETEEEGGFRERRGRRSVDEGVQVGDGVVDYEREAMAAGRRSVDEGVQAGDGVVDESRR